MKIVILGANGFLGKSLYNVLKNDCHEIVTYSHHELEIEKYFELPNADICYHFAQSPSIYKDNKNPLERSYGSILGTLNVIKACEKARIKRLVYPSTVWVYGDLWEKANESQKALGENKYADIYSFNKATSENCMLKFSDYTQPIIYRISYVYGGFMKKGLIYDIFKSILNEKKLKINLSSKSLLDLIYIDDVVSAMLMPLYKNFHGIYNLSSGMSLFIKSLCNEICKFTKNKSNFIAFGDDEIKMSISNDKLKRLGWKCESNKLSFLSKAIEETIKNIRQIKDD